MMRRAPLLAMLAVGLAACPRTDRRADIGMSDTTFVHTMLRLHAVAVDSSLDSLARDSARKVVLRENHVTAEQLDAAAESLAFDTKRAESLWTRIDRDMKKKGPPPPAAPMPAPAPAPKTP